MKKILITSLLILLPFTLSAQEKDTISVGEENVAYTEMIEESGISYYYDEDVLVVSEHNNKIWLVYRANGTILEAHDTNSDGTPDVFFELNAEEEVVSSSGEGVSQFERPEITTFESLIDKEGAGSDEDLAGDLSEITIPGGTSKTLIFALIIFVLVAGYVVWSRKQKVEEKEE